MSFLESVDLLAASLALFGVSTAILAQCGGNKRPEKKKLSSQQPSSKSKSVSSKAKSASNKSKRMVKKGLADAQRSGKSKRSSRKSKRSSVDKSVRSGKKRSKSDRSSKETATAKSLDSSKKAAKGSEQQNVKTAREQPGLLKSVKENVESKLDLNQKIHEKLGGAPVELKMEPSTLRFEEKGGLQKVKLHNPSNVRQAIKVKCSDNDLYRVSPVYSLIEPGQTLNLYIVRRPGNAKLDKIVILTQEFSQSAEADIQSVFKKQALDVDAYQPMVVLPLLV